jgi:Catalase-related immune-responsive
MGFFLDKIGRAVTTRLDRLGRLETLVGSCRNCRQIAQPFHLFHNRDRRRFGSLAVKEMIEMLRLCPAHLAKRAESGQRQEDEPRLLFENTARAMGDARIEVKQRHIANCSKADPAYGAGVAKALGINYTPQTIAAE